MRIAHSNDAPATHVDHAYATLARLKIVLPLAQAATAVGMNHPEATILSLIELVRQLTDRLASAAFASLDQLSPERRERLLRTVTQEVAHLVGRAHERGEAIDPGRLIEQVQLARSAIDQVPGASSSLFFDNTLDAQAQWQLAVGRAAARIVASLVLCPSFARQHTADALKCLLARVETSASVIATASAAEHRIVRISLLSQFAKAHAGLIRPQLLDALDRGDRPSFASLTATIDNYHEVLDVGLKALTEAGTQPMSGDITIEFSPQLWGASG